METVEERGEKWARVARTSGFRELMRKKKAFLIPATIFFMVFYFTLPVLTAFTTVLNYRLGDLISPTSRGRPRMGARRAACRTCPTR